MSPQLLGLAARQGPALLASCPALISSALILGLLSNLIGHAPRGRSQRRTRCFQFRAGVFNVRARALFSMSQACFQCPASLTLTVNNHVNVAWSLDTPA